MIYYIPIIITIILAYIPSFAWLGLVLSQDIHPEKSTDIAKAFVLGSFIAVPVVLFSIWGKEFLDLMLIQIPTTMSNFIFGAFAEEVIKGLFIFNSCIKEVPFDLFSIKIASGLYLVIFSSTTNFNSRYSSLMLVISSKII